VQTFYLQEVKSYTKNERKFGWVKYWQMTFNLPKFSHATILCNMVTEKSIVGIHIMQHIGDEKQSGQIVCSSPSDNFIANIKQNLKFQLSTYVYSTM